MKTVKNIGYVILILLGLAALVLLCTALMQIAMGVFGEIMNIAISEDTLYSVSGTLGIALVGILLAAYVRKKKNQDGNTQTKDFDIKKALVYGGLAICICQIFFSAVTTLFLARFVPMAYEQTYSGSICINIICGVILAPIGEELLFREGLYSLLKRRFQGVSAIVICALIFGMSHGYHALGIASCCLAGVIFTLIYEKTGSVWYSILAHAMCNLHSLIFNMMEQKGVTFLGLPLQYEVNGYNMYHVAVIVVAVLFCIAIVYFRNMRLKTVAAD